MTREAIEHLWPQIMTRIAHLTPRSVLRHRAGGKGAVKYSDKIRNAQLHAVADALGPAAVMKIYSGDVPSSCDAANPSGEMAELELPRRPFHVPDGGEADDFRAVVRLFATR